MSTATPAGLIEVMSDYRYPQAPPAWAAAVERAGQLLARAWPQQPSSEAASHLGAVALVVYVLAHSHGLPAAQVPATAVSEALGGETDVEGEPQALKSTLADGLRAAGHTSGEDPLQLLRLRLVRREPFAMTDVPLSLTGGLTRWPSALSDAAGWTRRVLDNTPMS